METDLMIDEIDSIHKKANLAFEHKDISAYMSQFDENLKYSNADATTLTKNELSLQTENYFKRIKDITTTYYRIKSSFEDETFTEKIARKSIVHLKNLIIFSKKQTIQTEEIFHWKKINGEWKVLEVEVALEEKY